MKWLPSWFIHVQVSFCSEDWLVTASGRKKSLRDQGDGSLCTYLHQELKDQSSTAESSDQFGLFNRIRKQFQNRNIPHGFLLSLHLKFSA